MNLSSDSVLFFLLTFSISWLLIRLYFKFAISYGIVDRPNERSSHSQAVIRGGGIIFVFALIFGESFAGFNDYFFLTGALLIALVSFLDDVKPQRAIVRASVHFISIVLLFIASDFLQFPWWIVFFAAIVAVGVVNAFNFMDGINGITGTYALVNLLTFVYINTALLPFVSPSVLLALLASVMVFLFFNFRKKARCFAGDVGSIILAYAQLFMVLLLVSVTKQFEWIFMFTVYGIDATVTIVYRLIRKENIFRPHRTHLYQYLANEMGFSHRIVSAAYGMIQMGVNILLIISIQTSSELLLLLGVGALGVVYLVVRYQVALRIYDNTKTI